MKQQTAVESLVKNVELISNTTTLTKEESIQLYNQAIEQAKELEKQQKIEFAQKCLDKALDLDVRTAYSQVEHYYNKTYENK
jgi:hypothetical protein